MGERVTRHGVIDFDSGLVERVACDKPNATAREKPYFLRKGC
jgi:hypothetical protein